MADEKKIIEAIGKIFEEHPDITMGDFLEAFSDWFAFASKLQPKFFSGFVENYLKWLVYYSSKDR